MNVYRRLKYMLDKKQKRKVLLLTLTIFIGSLLELLGVGVIVPLISVVVSPEDVLGNEKVKGIISALHLEGLSNTDFVLLMLVIAIAVFVFKNAYLLFQSYIQTRFVAKTQNETAIKLFGEFMNRPYEFYLNAETADMLRTLHTDIPHVFELLQESLLLISEVAVSACLCIFLFVMDPLMTLGIAALMLVMVLLILKGLKPKLGRLGSKRVELQGKTMKTMQHGLTGIKDVKVAAKENFFIREYASYYVKLADVGCKYTVLKNMPRLVIETVCIVGMLIYMFVLVMTGTDLLDRIPLLSAFAMAAVRLMPSVNRISAHMGAIAYFEPSLNLVCDNLDVASIRQREITEREVVRGKYEDKICLKNITYKYPNTERLILDSAEMEIPIGSTVGVIGASGAGKTTVVDILLGLLKLNGGEITADGKKVNVSDAEWLSNVGYIAQNIFMLDGTIRENVAFGIPSEKQDEKRIWEVLKEAQLDDFVRDLPDGLDTSIGERGVRVSGGQRQRIGIARALYNDPELLVFDEATSALDNDTEAAIMGAINSLKGRKTMVIIAHRLKTVENCDILYKVEKGKIQRTALEEH